MWIHPRWLGPALLAMVLVPGGCGGAEEPEPAAEDVATADPGVDSAEATDATELPGDDASDPPDLPADPGPAPDPGLPSPDPGPPIDAGPGPVCTPQTALVDCDDGVGCTIDECKSGKCLHTKEDNLCCLSTADCTDGDECTHDLCAAHHCVFPRRSVPACKCIGDFQCDAKNPCRSGKCVFGTCEYTPTGAAGCCAVAADCVDGSETTFESCQQGICWITDTACTQDTDCASPAACVTSACVDDSCVFDDGIATGCCETEAECDDAIALTSDQCLEGACVHTLGAPVPCTSDAQCVAPNACVQTSCDPTAGVCAAAPVAGPACCTSALDCKGADPCLANACEAFQCTSTPVAVNEVLWEENFDVGGLKWTVEGDGNAAKWQLVTTQAISKPHALYYGIKADKNYDTGAQTTGSATSATITPPGGKSPLLLTFARNVDTEPGKATDKVWLELVIGGVATTIWDKSFEGGPGIAWKTATLDITALATGPFQLRFRFDSVDGKLNGGSYEGVYVDNVRLETPCPAP